MRKAILAVAAVFYFTFAQAITHTVQVSNFQFSPSTLNVVVGDVVTFEWVSGFHTTTCDPAALPGTSFPAGATGWDSPMTSSSNSFSVTITTAGSYLYGCVPHFAGGMQGTINATGATTPVKLSDFTVAMQDNKASLTWKTVAEENTDYFSVRKSTNGKDFSEAGKIPAAGSSNAEKTYRFTDNIAASKSRFIYYMLATVDKDGKKELSKIVLLKNTSAAAKLITSISPNPVAKPGHLMIAFNSDGTGTMLAQVFDMQGKPVLQANFTAYEGVNNGHLHLGDLPAGNYSIVFNLNGTTETKRVILK